MCLLPTTVQEACDSNGNPPTAKTQGENGTPCVSSVAGWPRVSGWRQVTGPSRDWSHLEPVGGRPGGLLPKPLTALPLLARRPHAHAEGTRLATCVGELLDVPPDSWEAC